MKIKEYCCVEYMYVYIVIYRFCYNTGSLNFPVFFACCFIFVIVIVIIGLTCRTFQKLLMTGDLHHVIASLLVSALNVALGYILCIHIKGVTKVGDLHDISKCQDCQKLSKSARYKRRRTQNICLASGIGLQLWSW